MDKQCEITAKLRKMWTARGICIAEQDEIIAITTRKAKAGIHFEEGHSDKRNA